MKIGSDENGEFTFLDIIAIASFIIGVENLNENLTQGDKQDLQNQLSEELNRVVTDIHSHLQLQDEKIDIILEALKHDKD